MGRALPLEPKSTAKGTLLPPISYALPQNATSLLYSAKRLSLTTGLNTLKPKILIHLNRVDILD